MIAKIMVLKTVGPTGANNMYIDEINALTCFLRAFLYINKIPYAYEPPKPHDMHHVATITILHKDFENLDYPASQYVINYLKTDLLGNLVVNVQDS
jgi:hypothetical protein